MTDSVSGEIVRKFHYWLTLLVTLKNCALLCLFKDELTILHSQFVAKNAAINALFSSKIEKIGNPARVKHLTNSKSDNRYSLNRWRLLQSSRTILQTSTKNRQVWLKFHLFQKTVNNNSHMHKKLNRPQSRNEYSEICAILGSSFDVSECLFVLLSQSRQGLDWIVRSEYSFVVFSKFRFPPPALSSVDNQKMSCDSRGVPTDQG